MSNSTVSPAKPTTRDPIPELRGVQPGPALDVFQQDRVNPLDRLLAPRSVAVIGATETEGRVGRAVLENLKGFKGKVYPVNPSRASVLGMPAFPRVSLLPEAPDVAVIATPAETVPALVRECAQAGVAGAVVLAAGFREVGERGIALEAEVLAAARSTGLRIIGPNCLGFMAPHLGFNATFARDIARPGNVAFLSQSGALCTAILDWSLREHVGFSGFLSLGSMLDVGWGDLINWFGDDPNTHSIICYMESVGDAREFLSAAREVALTKPIIVLKVGQTEAGARAAASHTGSLAGSDAVLEAAFRRIGVLRVKTLGELFDMAEVLSKQPRPAGPHLAVVTNAGGPGALAADVLGAGSNGIAELQPSTLQALNEFLPPHWSHGNPVDLLGDADAARYERAIRLVAADPGADGLLVILTPQAMTDSVGSARGLVAAAKGVRKPILACWMGGGSVDEGRAILNEAGIPTYDTPDTAARAFTLMWRYSENLRSLYETPEAIEADETQAGNEAAAAAILAQARAEGRSLLNESESKRFLALHGFPVLETVVARSPEEAVAEATRIGFPVVVKLHSNTITHKSDVGGVHLNLRNAAAVTQAWNEIRSRVEQVASPADFLGVSVQKMISGSGVELILGSSVDPQFGPVVLFGAGGKLVEVMKDTAVGLPPLTRTLARRLMEQTRILAALKGARGEAPVDLGELEEILVRFANLVATQPALASVEFNPLLASAAGIIGLDARVMLRPVDAKPARFPAPAIRPYPAKYRQKLQLRNGTEVVVRPIRPDDEPMMIAFHETLSERSVYNRYFAPLKLQERISHERLSRICFVDYDREMVLVAEAPGETPDSRRIVAVGRLSKQHGENRAEFALTVGDPWQNHGLGSALLKQLVRIGHDEELDEIVARILVGNRAMQHVARREGFRLQHPPGSVAEFEARLVLRPPAPGTA